MYWLSEHTLAQTFQLKGVTTSNSVLYAFDKLAQTFQLKGVTTLKSC